MMPSDPRHIDLGELYQEVIREHYKDPRNYGRFDSPDYRAEGFNPLCGDRVVVEVKVDPKTEKTSLKFEAEACSICKASASMMMEEVEDKKIPAVLERIQKFRDLFQGKSEASEFEGDIQSLVGVKKFPVRIKCALLPWTTLKEALSKKPERGK